MFRLLTLSAGAIAAAGALCVTLPAAEAEPAPSSGGSCILLSQMQGMRMQGLRILYIRAVNGKIYRLDFNNDCDDVGGEPLILHPVTNNDQICSAIELDVRIRHTGEMCTPISMRRLTPNEAAAIPPKYRP
jgi:hypothetical protein